MKNVLETKGDSPRVYRNTIIFLCPSDTEKNAFLNSIRRMLAYEQIQSDKTLKLTEDQKSEIFKNISKEKADIRDMVKSCYRFSYVPIKDGLKEIDLGIPTYGEEKGLDEWVYEVLRAEQEILEKISPTVIQQKYLGNKDFVNVQLIYESMLKTQGERRLVSRDSFKESILQGVKEGLFGLGEVDGNSVRCKYFKTDLKVMLDENEVIIRDSICTTQKEPREGGPSAPPEPGRRYGQGEGAPVGPTSRGKDYVTLKFEVPRGKVSQILGMVNFLQSKFERLEVTISAKEGSITDEEYENKIKETLRQLGIDRDED